MKLNLINREKSDIGYSIFRFPDGEVQMILGEFSRKELVDIECRITNAERLVKKYRSITREELAKVYASICEEESNEMRDVLQEITGFGSLSKCSLCTAIVEDNIQYSACLYCIHRNFRDFAAPCVYHETYEAIEKSKNLDELMEAIRLPRGTN